MRDPVLQAAEREHTARHAGGGGAGRPLLRRTSNETGRQPNATRETLWPTSLLNTGQSGGESMETSREAKIDGHEAAALCGISCGVRVPSLRLRVILKAL